MAARVTGGFKQAKRAVAKVAVEDAGIVDGDFLFLAGSRVHAFLNERLGDGGHILDAAVEPDGGVDAMREQIAGHTAASRGGVKAP